METLWIVVGVVVLVVYLISKNKTKTTDNTIIRQKDTYKTETGEVTIERTKVVETSQMTFNAPQPVQANSAQIHHQAQVVARTQQENVNESSASNAMPKPQIVATTHHVELNPAAEKIKQCTRCRVNLPFSKFSKSSKHPDGATVWCTECLKGDKNTKHMKWCPKCKIRRKRTSFYPNNQNADGLMAWCKTCWDKHKSR